jgi:hypothetical protein
MIIAIAVFVGPIKGFVKFSDNSDNNLVKIEVNLTGLKKADYTDFMFMNLEI